MREDPGLDVAAIATTLAAGYGLRARSVSYLPIGYDLDAAVYRVLADDGAAYFLKIRFGPVDEAGLAVPRMLIDGGVPNVLAPIRTASSALWCRLDGTSGYSVVLYPFVEGGDAVATGLSDEQWREFGTTLRAVHASGLGERLRGRLPVEGFGLPSAALVRRLLALPEGGHVGGDAPARFAGFWREHADQIRRILARAEALGARLRARRFDLVLCHADIHAANVRVGGDGRIWLVDWDGPLIAPRERDLLFVVGSRIARAVQPWEEDRFFEGYGPAEIDAEALVYYRYERIVEDIGEMGKRVLLAPDVAEVERAAEAALAMGYFAVGGMVERAESVPRRRWPDEATDPPGGAGLARPPARGGEGVRPVLDLDRSGGRPRRVL